MGKDRTFLQRASKLWPVGHGRFEQMCALAITGQLGGAQMCELDEHIASCDRCRQYLQSVAQVSVQVMPLLAEKYAPDRKLLPPEGMRGRFLERLTAETSGVASGTKLGPFPLRAGSVYTASREQRTSMTAAENKRSPSPFFSMWRPIAIATTCIIAVLVAYYAGTQITVQPPPQVTQTHPFAPSIGPATPKLTDSDRVSEMEWQKSELETKLATMRQALATARSERESLNKDLAVAKERLAAMTTQMANRQTRDSPVVVQQTSDQVSALQADVSRLSHRLAESDINFGIQKQENSDLSSRLALTEGELQRERDLKSAKSEMGELAASRNLHIVDVYDADPNGKRQQSFGRVFYIEGQSLVFYAYDLDDVVRFRANVVFHVWGGKAGLKEVTHSLGILHKDDSGQNRWAMTFDDPNVLAQINSVFVTAEAATKHYDQPHGKKVLYAYFGSPANHP